MKQMISLLLITAMLTSGCMRRFHVSNPVLLPVTRDECDQINAEFLDRKAELFLTGMEDRIDLQDIRIYPDSLYCVDLSIPQKYSVPLDAVQEISYTNHTKGLLYFGLAGTALAVILITLHSTGGKESQDKAGGMAEGWKTVFKEFFYLIALSGAIALPLAGWIQGIQYKYEFPESVNVIDIELLEDLIDDDQTSQVSDILNDIINNSQDQLAITTALFLKIRYELDDQSQAYRILTATYPNSLYTLLATQMIMERNPAAD